METDKEKIELALSLFLEKYNIPFDVAYIRDLIYNSNKDMMVAGNKKYMPFRMDIFDKYDIDFSQNLIDLTTACWNNFPHKELNEKCPTEIFKG